MTSRGALRAVLLLVVAIAGAAALLLRPGDSIPDGPYPIDFRRSESRAGARRLVDSRLDVMGTRFTIEVAAPDESSARRAALAAWERIHGLEKSMSTWIEESNLSRVNREAADRPDGVDEDTFDVLLRSRDYFRLSGGAFDPTVGPLVRLWRPLSRLPAPPSDAEIAAARALVGYDAVELDPAGRTVRFARAGMLLDVGAVAKGYAADRAGRAALAAGARACRVNAGGDLACLGVPPWSPDGFEVEIRDPAGDEGDALPGWRFHLRDRAIATSGNYERFTEIAGRRYSHIVDPRTGRPVPDAVTQVTVIASTGTEADALATALTVLGPERGLALAAGLPDVQALFLLPEGDGWRCVATPGFPARDP